MNKEGVTGRWAKKRKRTWLSVNLLVYTSGIISFPGERERDTAFVYTGRWGLCVGVGWNPRRTEKQARASWYFMDSINLKDQRERRDGIYGK